MPRRIHRHSRNKRKKTNDIETNRPQSENVALNDIEVNRPQSENVASDSTETKNSKVKNRFPKTRLTNEEYEQLQRLRKLCGEESDSAFIRSCIKIRLNYLDTLKSQFDDHFDVSEIAYEPKYSGNYKVDSLDPIIKLLQQALSSTQNLEESSEKDLYKMVINFLIMHLKNSQNDNLQYK